MIRSCLRAALACAVALAAPLAAKAQQELKIFNWSDYVDPAVLDAFTKETGIKVIYDTFDQMEAVETKLMAGKSGYDLVVVTASFLPRHIPLKLYTELDKGKLQNLKHMWPEITAAWRNTMLATNMPSITCGAPPASATMSRRSRNVSAPMR